MSGRSAGAERSSFGGLVGRSPAMRRLFERCTVFASESHPVLIQGEMGSGKDLLARALHAESPRQAGPFVSFECGAHGSEALLGELFGRRTPAGVRPGALELAAGGTLLVDEPAELPRPVQQQLAAALAQKRFARQGDGVEIAFEARLLVASRRPLALELARERVVPELATDLSAFALTLPPLRERREDIPTLAQSFVSSLAGPAGGVVLSHDALEALALHDWPGNVRELRNVVERLFYALKAGAASARRLGPLLLASELPSVDRRQSAPVELQEFEPGLSYREQRARFEAAFEQRYVAWLLARHDGNVSAAARDAEMDRKYLDKLARRHALKGGGK